MSALRKLAAVFTPMAQKEREELAHAMVVAAESTHRLVVGLATRPVTVAEFLGVTRVDHAIDFAFLDALLARGDKLLAADPDAYYIEHGIPTAIAGCVDLLRSALAAAGPYREITRP